MSDLIRREDVVSRISDLLMIELQGKRLPTWNEVYNAINGIPSAEPERTAKVEQQANCWEDISHYREGMCASCGRNVYDHAKYCDECGARLEWK